MFRVTPMAIVALSECTVNSNEAVSKIIERAAGSSRGLRSEAQVLQQRAEELLFSA